MDQQNEDILAEESLGDTAVTCPDCEEEIEVGGDAKLGDVVVCDSCGVELEVVDTEPVEVDYLFVEK